MPVWPGRVSHTAIRHTRVTGCVDIRNGSTWPCPSPCPTLCLNKPSARPCQTCRVY
ncbi:hypothetical protein F383_37819 [Gossypium arboreum]|uniref:Uncharacterized protein n=1 Tax=Gossypium arboreum TaxID=29729 RepID=A0A0B0MDT0_GOSAR|nr:hypothetical protein F383_37819 [Gossypium arboreum]